MEQIIYIEQNDKDEATKLSKSFTLKEISNRAYINSLGAEIALKYLAQTGINVSNAYNLHNINKIREEFDIADIMLPNIHIDVRMVYSSEEIFIPKTHFEYNLVPDIYLVFEVAQDSTHVKFLGYFEPKLINKNNKNKDYYFIEKEKLSNPDNLKAFIDNYSGNTTQSLTEDEEDFGQKLALSLIDNDITAEHKKELINMLKKSSVLRQDLIEFDNFELISYHTSQVDDFQNYDAESAPVITQNVDEFQMFDTPFESEISSEVSLEPVSDLQPIQEPNNIAEPTLETLENIEPINEIPTIENVAPLETLEPIDNIQPIEELTPIENIETIDEIQPIEELTPIETLEPIDNIQSIDSIQPIEEVQEIPELETLETIDSATEIHSIEEPTSLETLEPINETESMEVSNAIDTPQLIDEIQPIEELTQIDTPQPVDNIQPIEEVEGISTLETLETLIEQDTNTPTTIEMPKTVEDVEINETYSGNIIQELISEEKEAQEEIDFTTESYDALDTLFNDGNSQPSAPKTTTPPPIPPAPTTPQTAHQEEQPEITKNQVFENSTIITNKNMNAGEIHIDINGGTTSTATPSRDAVEEIQSAISQKPSNNKKSLLTAVVLLAIIGSGLAFTLLNKKPATKNIAKQPSKNKIAQDLPVIPTEEGLNDPIKPLNTELPSVPNEAKQTAKTEKKNNKAEEKKVIEKQLPKGPAIETPYLEVKRLSWSIPDYLSYNEPFKNYLQTTGKSLKLTLSSDLLLATEYSYSNKLQVDIKLSKTGAIEDVKMLQSSGSTQIDDIVLRTVKNTLNVLKAPNDAIVGDNLHLTLIISL